MPCAGWKVKFYTRSQIWDPQSQEEEEHPEERCVTGNWNLPSPDTGTCGWHRIPGIGPRSLMDVVTFLPPGLSKEQSSQNGGPAAFLFPHKPQDWSIPRLLEGKEKLPSDRMQDFPKPRFQTHLPSLRLPAAPAWARSGKSGSMPACSAGIPLEPARSGRNAGKRPLRLQGTRNALGDIWEAGFAQINPTESLHSPQKVGWEVALQPPSFCHGHPAVVTAHFCSQKILPVQDEEGIFSGKHHLPC